MKRICQLLAAAIATGATGIFVCAADAPPSIGTPTHKEIAPIKFSIGPEGCLKTIAMDRRGNLLAGVSFAAAAGAALPPAPARAQAAPDARQIIAALDAAIQGNTSVGWDRVLQQISPEDFRAAMTGTDKETRSRIVSRLPDHVRAKLMQGMSRGGGSGRSGGPGGMTDTRGGIMPNLSTDHAGHAYALKVVSPEGAVLATWTMHDGLQPKMIFGCDDGTVYVAGGGRLAQFAEDGRLVKMVDTDQIYGQKAAASGLCADAAHVYLAFGMGNSVRATEDFFRFNRDLSAPKMIVERQYGCCSHIDLRVANGELLIAENSRHRMNRFDLDGKPLGTWGRRDRENLAGFTACCNPCNFDIGPGGVLYTAESGVGRVKKYKADGTFLGLVGYVDTTKFDGGSQLAATSCYIPIEVNRDASRIYVMDVRAAIIRVLAKNN